MLPSKSNYATENSGYENETSNIRTTYPYELIVEKEN